MRRTNEERRLRSRMRAGEAIRLAAGGLAARRTRSILSALGIAVAVAALVSVLGLSDSSQARLLAQLGAEGNLLTVATGQTFSGNITPLPSTAETMIGAIPPVEDVTAVGTIAGATVRRSAAVPEMDTSGISVVAAQGSLLPALDGRLIRGQYLGRAATTYPEVVLGFSAAQNLGIATLGPQTQVFIDGRYFAVVGILAPVVVAPELDDAALVTFPLAKAELGFDGTPTRIYLRTDPDRTAAVAAVLPFTASPDAPDQVEVRRPSDVLAARLEARNTFVDLFVALAGVALLVGGVGIANIMVIAVFERRTEIGLRRALGARSRHVSVQFFLESILLSACGGVAGVALGAAVTWVVATVQGTPPVVSLGVAGPAVAATIVVGAVAGIYPAARAARLAPADALRSA
ncbi:ABC transporter permease [Diaminobutyricibacter tongyongensis]|uniref:ABC transporter permease n=1 Tax=Leifsonia tongyongensis TaxID=1268043 RepID=A0A6L9XYZ2_9MICO|nr:ABC transporter permease [Diaminobutyricibacter tongyongensis]NEN06633.1 ABC transporter permease [Diaminobutyricibacter tongyongensis]